MSQELNNLLRAVYERWKVKFTPEQGRHPEEEDFASFVENKLSAQDTAWIKKHVLTCDSCAEILSASLKLNGLQELEPPEGLLKNSFDSIIREISVPRIEIFLQIKDRVLEVINTTGDVLLGQELVPAAVLRSRKISDFRDKITVLKDFGKIRVEAKIEAKTSGAFELQVVIKEKQHQSFIKDLRVSLIKADLELESYLSDSGKVVFEHVLLGEYVVQISSLTGKVAEILIDLKPKKIEP